MSRSAGALAALCAAAMIATPAAAKKKKKDGADPEKPPVVEVGGSKKSADNQPESAGGDEFGGAAASTAMFTLRTLLQTRYRVTSVDQADMSAPLYEQVRADERENDGLRVERAYLRVTAQPTPQLTAKLVADFAELLYNNENNTLKRASVEFRPNDVLRFEAGFFKLPFSLLELISTAELEYSDDGPLDDLIKDLGYAGRDVGALITLTPLERARWLRLELGAFNGENQQGEPYSGPGTYSARISSRPVGPVRLGADCTTRPRDVDVWNDDTLQYDAEFTSGTACSTDAAFAYKRFAIRAEWITGRRTDARVLAVQNSSLTGRDRNFVGVWGVVSYRLKLPEDMSLTPAVRVEWMDEDTVDPVGENTFISGTMSLDFSASTRLLFDLTRSEPQEGTLKRTDVTPLRRTATTTGTVQLQIVL